MIGIERDQALHGTHVAQLERLVDRVAALRVPVGNPQHAATPRESGGRVILYGRGLPNFYSRGELLVHFGTNQTLAVNGEEHGRTSAFATPGFVYMDRWVELGVAGRFPLNQAAHDELDWGVIFIVDLFIDDILPWTRWQPIGGMGAPTPMPGTGAS